MCNRTTVSTILFCKKCIDTLSSQTINVYFIYKTNLYTPVPYLVSTLISQNPQFNNKIQENCKCNCCPTVITLHILNLTIFLCEHFLHCWFTPTDMTILYCYNSIYYIISKIFCLFLLLNVVIKCNCYLYIITCWRMEYKIVCKYVERTFVSWNNLCPIQMLYS